MGVICCQYLPVSIVTLRCVTATRGNHSPVRTTTFKQKSQSQIKRDRERLEHFQNRAKTRSHTEIENQRHSDSGAENFSESNLSPVTSICSSGSPQTFSPPIAEISSSSESIPSEVGIEIPPLSDVERYVVVPAPSVSDGPDTSLNSCTKPKIALSERADGVDSGLFYKHISNRSAIEYDDIKCSDCAMFIRSIAVVTGYDRLMYCENCDMYTCTKCRPPSKCENMTHSSKCNSLICFIT